MLREFENEEVLEKKEFISDQSKSKEYRMS